MSERSITECLPGRLLHVALRADLVEYLRVAPLPAAARRKLYKRWCTFTYSSELRSDLDTIAPRRATARQARLLE
jgi:hypothetical protein